MKLTINQLSYLKSLHQRKYRQKYHNFIVEGVKLAAETLDDGRHEIEAIFAVPEWVEANAARLQRAKVPVHPIAPAELKKASLLSTPNSVLMVVRQKDALPNAKVVRENWSLFLEDIQDPGNFGSILRIADWFGIPCVFCSEGCVEAHNPKVVQASMGAFLRVQAIEKSAAQFRAEFPEVPVFAATLEGQNVFSKKWGSCGLLAIGNESKGISTELLRLTDEQISIPKGANGGAESLNAAVATGILCATILCG